VEDAAANGVELIYYDTGKEKDPVAALLEITGGTGYDDVFVFAPVSQVVEQGDAILGYDGCMNFFAGPSDESFRAAFNFYNVHYNATHLTGTSGGNTDDMLEALHMATLNRTSPAILVTHIGGLDSAKDATLNLPSIPGGKKVIYNHISMPLTAIEDFEEKGKSEPLFAELARICAKTDGLWNVEAERYLLANAAPLDADRYLP
jgi:threonine dehydrogenase-like Zn-dependent dehydrogenase